MSVRYCVNICRCHSAEDTGNLDVPHVCALKASQAYGRKVFDLCLECIKAFLPVCAGERRMFEVQCWWNISPYASKSVVLQIWWSFSVNFQMAFPLDTKHEISAWRVLHLWQIRNSFRKRMFLLKKTLALQAIFVLTIVVQVRQDYLKPIYTEVRCRI